MHPRLFALLALGTAVWAQAGKTVDPAFFRGDPTSIADACVARARTMKGVNADILLTTARVHLAAGRMEAAETALQGAEEAAPKDWDTYQRIMHLWVLSQHPDRAIATLRRAAGRLSASRDNLAAIGVAWSDLGLAKEADEAMLKAYLKDTRDWKTILMFARASLRQGRREQAAQWHERAVLVGANDGGMWSLLAQGLADQGKEP